MVLSNIFGVIATALRRVQKENYGYLGRVFSESKNRPNYLVEKKHFS